MCAAEGANCNDLDQTEVTVGGKPYFKRQQAALEPVD
jgi:hypothetical protein